MFAPLAVAVLVAATPARPKLAVLELRVGGGADPTVARGLSGTITTEVEARGYFNAISSEEISTMLGVERQKQLLGCGESSCTTEIADALGAPYVMSGSLTKLESVYQLNLEVMEASKMRPIGRSTRLAKDLPSLRDVIPYVVAEACGTPLPPPPSRVLPITLISAGALSFVAGSVLGIVALNNDAVLRSELGSDNDNTSVVLASAQSYRSRLDAVALQKTGALIALGAGAALVALGLILNPPDPGQGGVRVSLVPNGLGASLVGVLP